MSGLWWFISFIAVMIAMVIVANLWERQVEETEPETEEFIIFLDDTTALDIHGWVVITPADGEDIKFKIKEVLDENRVLVIKEY